MRYKVAQLHWALFFVLVPLALGGAVARAADKQGAGNFKVMLSDGGTMQGAISFVISLDTQYGLIKIPSSIMLSARFDPARQWADIRLNEAELKLKYKPASSDIKATTSAGPLNIELAKVVTIDNGSVRPPSASSPNATANEGNVPPPPAYVQQPPPVAVAPSTPLYQYAPYTPPPEPYYYTASDYYPAPDYYVAPEPYLWPDYGFGVVVGPGFGFGGLRGHGGFRGGFGGGFHGGGFGGHGGGFGGHGGGGGHR